MTASGDGGSDPVLEAVLPLLQSVELHVGRRAEIGELLDRLPAEEGAEGAVGGRRLERKAVEDFPPLAKELDRPSFGDDPEIKGRADSLEVVSFVLLRDEVPGRLDVRIEALVQIRRHVVLTCKTKPS